MVALEIPYAVKTAIDGVCIVIGISVFLFVRGHSTIIMSVFLERHASYRVLRHELDALRFGVFFNDLREGVSLYNAI